MRSNERSYQRCYEVTKNNTNPSNMDASIIIACKKLNIMKIASYGSARAIARHLNDAGLSSRIDFDEIADILQQTSMKKAMQTKN